MSVVRHSANFVKTLDAVMLCLGLMACLIPATSFAESENPLVVDAPLLIELAKIRDSQIADLSAGQVVVLNLDKYETVDVNEFDIYSGFAILIKADTVTVGEVLGRPEWAGSGIPGAIASFIDGDSDFPPVVFSESDADEISRILKGRKEVNLSKAELQKLQSLGLKAKYDAKELEQFSDTYREILRDRYESYLERGLDGIPLYEDRGDSWAPADHFRQVNVYWNAWLPKVSPDYAQELSLKSAEIDSAIDQDFLLVRKTVGSRPIYSLAHRMGRVTGNVIAAAHREYFVSGAYGAMQIIFIGVPYEEGTLLLLGSDAFTEKVAGFGSGMKHNVGRGMMNDVLRGMLLELRAQAELVAQKN